MIEFDFLNPPPDLAREVIRTRRCPYCLAAPGLSCSGGLGGRFTYVAPHAARYDAPEEVE